MESRTLTLAGRYYDGTAPMFRGLATLPGFDLRLQEEPNTSLMFRNFFEGKYDASEMSLAELVYYTSRDRNEFLAIPVFPSRVFRHGYLFCDATAGLTGLEDLSGRRIGFQRWVQTAGVWMRGMLIDEYGVSPQKTDWYVSSMHHWTDDSGTVVPRDGSIVRLLSGAEHSANEEDPHDALVDHRLDAIGITEGQIEELEQDGRVRRLVEDWAGAEVEYYRKTRIFPIMHAIAIRKSAIERLPGIPTALFGLFADAKRLAREALRSTPSMTLAWKDRYLEGEREIFGADAWTYGLSANEHTVAKFLDYCFQQGIAARPLEPRELFAPETWNLLDP